MDPSTTKTAESASESTTVRYMQQVIAWQTRLYAFILSLTGNPNEADDVLQNTNLALLQKQSDYRPDANFLAWAMQMAYLEVQRHRDSNARAKRRIDDALLDQLAAKAQESIGEPTAELRTLRDCMLRLSPSEREMLTLRYGGKSILAIAESWGRTVGSISQTLYRVRGKLAECMKRALRAEHRDEP